MPSPVAYVLVDGLEDKLEPLSTRDLLVHIGQQVASKVDESSLIFVVRSAPNPTLAALGPLCEEYRNRLSHLSTRIRSILSRARYVKYAQVERDCEVLARRLTDRLGQETLHNAHFVGIPRGGLIVLGMLSYTLDLPHAQLEHSSFDDGPLVVVDDCALTGSRVHSFLQQHPDREVIFAPLYAHPNLCAAIERDEPRVTACTNAQDLYDYAPEELGDDYSEWRTQWRERHSDKRYWIGRTEHLCFPWGEADTATWNSERERVEQGLSVVPPEHRLKTRPGTAPSQRENTDSVQVQPTPAGPLRPAPPVLFGQVDDNTIVANPETDLCVELDGTAAAMWHMLVEHGTVDGTVEVLRQTYPVDVTTLRTDLVDFVDRLATHDLLHVPDGSLA